MNRITGTVGTPAEADTIRGIKYWDEGLGQGSAGCGADTDGPGQTDVLRIRYGMPSVYMILAAKYSPVALGGCCYRADSPRFALPGARTASAEGIVHGQRAAL